MSSPIATMTASNIRKRQRLQRVLLGAVHDQDVRYLVLEFVRPLLAPVDSMTSCPSDVSLVASDEPKNPKPITMYLILINLYLLHRQTVEETVGFC
jgi:hypothetical protein